MGETALPKGVPFDRQRESPLKWGIAIFKGALLVAPIAVGAVCAVASANAWPLVIGILVGFVLFANTYVVLEWEAAVVLRLGRLERIQGPGLFFTVPFIEFVASYVDQRLNATTFNAERALTADCVPVDVDAVLFWMVWDPKSACTEVKNYYDAVFWAAQTTLRDAIGSIDIAELSTRRKALDEEIKAELVQKTETWGVTVVSVEIRDIVIPTELQDALSKEAQAERERNARVTLAEAEEDVSEMFVRATRNYKAEDGAVQLRAMNMLYDGVKEKGGLVLVPTSLADAFGEIGSSGKQAADEQGPQIVCLRASHRMNLKFPQERGAREGECYETMEEARNASDGGCAGDGVRCLRAPGGADGGDGCAGDFGCGC